jgi:hypothetical protein
MNPSKIETREIFWIYLNDLYEDLDKKETYLWYNLLKEKKYKGVIYQIVNCQGKFISDL